MTQNTQVTALEHCKTPHKNAPHKDFTHHYGSIYHLDADFNWTSHTNLPGACSLHRSLMQQTAIVVILPFHRGLSVVQEVTLLSKMFVHHGC